MRGWKWLLVVIGSMVMIGGFVTLWNKLEYFTPHPLIAHHRITMTLPYTTANAATNMIPMGETIAHNFYGGHPGIDFQWDHSVPLIAAATGKITSIKPSNDMGEPVQTLTLSSGEYRIVYQELEKPAPGIAEGQTVSEGTVIGYPHCVVHTDINETKRTGCQVHWEFGYNRLSLGFERLCPVSYFTAADQVRLTDLWNSVPANDKFKLNAPHICSNIYTNRNQ